MTGHGRTSRRSRPNTRRSRRFRLVRSVRDGAQRWDANSLERERWSGLPPAIQVAARIEAGTVNVNDGYERDDRLLR